MTTTGPSYPLRASRNHLPWCLTLSDERKFTRRLLDRFAGTLPVETTPPTLDSLTARELEILRLLATGSSNAEIAGELVVSEATVKTHVSSVLRKLGVRDRVQAVMIAYDTGLVRPRAG